MCTVLAATGVSIGLQLIGGGMKNIAQNKADNENISYLNSMAAADEKQAKQVIEAADIQQKYLVTNTANQTKESRNMFKQVIGSQKVVLAGKGIAAGSRTGQDLALDALTESEKEENLIRYNATVSSEEIFRNSSFQADQLRTRAQGYKKAARNIKKSKSTNFLSNLLNTGAGVTNTLLQYKTYAGR